LSQFLFSRNLQRKQRSHLVLKDFTEWNRWVKGIVESNQDIAESADVSVTAQPDAFKTLFKDSLIEFGLYLFR
jgi:hypothetical protein